MCQKKKTAVIIVAIIVLLIALFLILMPKDTPTANPAFGAFEVTENRRGGPASQDTGSGNSYISFFGYGKSLVSEKNPSIELYNPSQNTVNMVFEVLDSETNELIARTNDVLPGEYAYVNVVDFYKSAGIHSIDINTSTIDADTDAPMNGMHQQMEIIIQTQNYKEETK